VGPDHPDTLVAISKLALSYGSQNRWQDALRLHREVLELRQARLTSDHPETLISMYHVGNTLLSLGQGDEAIEQFDEIIRRAEGKPVNPRLVPSILERRIRHYAARNDPAACRANAQQWESLTDKSAEFLAHAAQLWSMTSQVQAQATGVDAALRARQDADQAMHWLTQAVAAGYRNRKELETNPDFEALHGRDDFQELLQPLNGME
jgi:tetratricopeptide (TPR) repeat protein